MFIFLSWAIYIKMKLMLRDPGGGESVPLINEYWLESILLVILGNTISS